MKAAVYEGKEQIVVREVADPVLAKGEVLLEIDACCICGADLRTYRHGHNKIKPPRVLGHEFCGRVVESRADAAPGVGSRVVMYIVMPCGTCRYCRLGRENLCDTRTTIAYEHDGALARCMSVPARAVSAGQLFVVKSDVTSPEMALAEPLGCTINAHDRLEVCVHDTVAVIGAGPIGVMHAALARLEGAQRVYILDVSENRLQLARDFDVDEAIAVDCEGSHLECMRELTGGLGADVVIVACPSGEAQTDAIEMAGKGARVEFFGGLPKSAPTAMINTNHLHYKEITVTGSFSEKMRDFEAAQALVQGGRFPSERIITHTLPLERVTEAFELMESGQALKVCVEPGA